MKSLVILSHGQESGPDATKVTRLAAVAQARGCRAERPDYRGIVSPVERTAKLVARIREAAAEPARVILVGSSMGSFISGLASVEVPVAGLFLLALPLSVGEEWPVYAQAAVPTELVHGWHDELIPAQDVVDFAAQRSLALHLVDDDHRLGASVDRIEGWFGDFLDRTLA